MQYIELRLEDENGSVIEKSDVNFVDIVKVLENKKESYPWLYSVDPYGLTMFNKYQTPHLIDELQRLSENIDDRRLLADIDETIKFFSKIEEHVHVYIKLIGD